MCVHIFQFFLHLFVEIFNFSLSPTFLIFFGFEPQIIRKLFVNIEGVIPPENKLIAFKSLLISYFIIKQAKSGAEYQILYRFFIILKLLLNFSDSEPGYSSKLFLL